MNKIKETKIEDRDCLLLDEGFMEHCSKCNFNDVCEEIDILLEKKAVSN